MGSATLILNQVDRSSEHIALRSFLTSDALDVALIAPEDPFCRDNGRLVLEWLIGESTADDVKLRGSVMREIETIILGSDDPCPWFSLVSQRWHDSKLTIKSNFEWIVRCPLPLAPSREEWDFSEIADAEDCELFSVSVPNFVPPEDPRKRAESVTVALTVDYSRFTDREIVEAFTKWVKENRPTDWKVPPRVFPNAPQRGRKLVDYRVALERLGLMRLLNDNYPDELRWGYPDIWKRLCRDGTHVRRDCQLACDFFRSLFPFLPEDEIPRCAKPVEVWEPEIVAELAREKEDNRSAGGKSESI